MNANQQVNKVQTLLLGARIAKDTRSEVDRELRRLRSSVPVQVENVPTFVPTDWYGAQYYWQGRDPAEARAEAPALAKVRAVNIDHLTGDNIRERRTPSAWAPRVELTLTTAVGETADERTLVGDLSARKARELAMSLLAAAELIEK